MRDSRARELRDRIIAWKLTPEDKRQPLTLTELAAEEGVSKSLASYYAQQAPGSIEELIDSAEGDALRRYPRVLDTLADLAEKGSVEAIRVYIRGIVEPRRPQQQRRDALAVDIRLQQAFQLLPAVAPQPSGDGTPPAPALLPGANGATGEEFNCPISSNSNGDEESAS